MIPPKPCQDQRRWGPGQPRGGNPPAPNPGQSREEHAEAAWAIYRRRVQER